MKPAANDPNPAPGKRGIRLAERPTVSVVVASCRDTRLLDACLRSLLPQCNQHAAELVVARACEVAELDALAAAYPDVRFAAANPPGNVPELRAAGMAAATGDVVALTEDHCVVGDQWLSELLGVAWAGTDVAGGAMDNAQQDRAVDWAAYFAEYGFFGQGANDGGVASPLLTGANVAYSRRVVPDVIALARAGEWENVAHARLAARGSTFQFLRTAAVSQNENYRFAEFCRDRFQHGRDYARRRLAEEGDRRRWLYLVGSALLPFLLMSRVARALSRRQRKPFLRALPLTFGFLVAWSVGEFAGYWSGPQATAGTERLEAERG